LQSDEEVAEKGHALPEEQEGKPRGGHRNPRHAPEEEGHQEAIDPRRPGVMGEVSGEIGGEGQGEEAKERKEEAPRLS
ncbi:hypothetical protein CDQ85_19440, partial [Clostridium thermosuccinogenes]